MDYRLLADQLLIKLLRANDEEALRMIYVRYWRPLFLSVVKKIRVREIAEELVQNVFVSLWEKRHSTHVQELGPYLHTAVKYQAINYIKSNILHKAHAKSMALQVVTEENYSASSLLIHELTNAIDNAIQHLPQKTQLVFRLSRFENRSVSEISAFLNISEKAVEYHITRSIKFLRFQLKDFIILEICLLLFSQ